MRTTVARLLLAALIQAGLGHELPTAIALPIISAGKSGPQSPARREFLRRAMAGAGAAALWPALLGGCTSLRVLPPGEFGLMQAARLALDRSTCLIERETAGSRTMATAVLIRLNDPRGAPLVPGRDLALVTNAHAVEGAQPADVVATVLRGAGSYTGRPAFERLKPFGPGWPGMSPTRHGDLAVLWAGAADSHFVRALGLDPLPLAYDVRSGEPDVALGYPWGRPRVDEGRILDVRSDRLRTSLNIDHGNSGGPSVVERDGALAVVGLNSSMVTGPDESWFRPGLGPKRVDGLALPSWVLAAIARRLLRGEGDGPDRLLAHVPLGVMAEPLSNQRMYEIQQALHAAGMGGHLPLQASRVTASLKTGPAGNLKAGDLLLGFAHSDEAVMSWIEGRSAKLLPAGPAELRAVRLMQAPNSTITFELLRPDKQGGLQLRRQALSGQLTDHAYAALLLKEIGVEASTDSTAGPVTIRELRRDVAGATGLQPGDVLQGAQLKAGDSEPVFVDGGPWELVMAMLNADTTGLQVRRGGRSAPVVLQPRDPGFLHAALRSLLAEP
ncbi:MAG: trypsin-like peptidase domain-containing protein [Proteobacteria bacterium]|nr:trypsin-like peptidase domain-containing protein [Pseudomonadota bacterium]